MSIADRAPAGSLASVKRPSWTAGNWGLLAAIAVLIAILLLPNPAGLPVAATACSQSSASRSSYG